MANEIFGVDIAAIVSDTFTGNLHPITLYRVTQTVDAYGSTTETSVTHAGDGVRGKWMTQTMIARGWPEDTAKITIIQNGIPAPRKGDKVGILSEQFRVLDVEQDPVNATWTVAAVREV